MTTLVTPSEQLHIATFGDVLVFATGAHAGQKRLSGTDYIEHPIAVAAILRENGFGDHEQRVALLHDVLEIEPSSNAVEVGRLRQLGLPEIEITDVEMLTNWGAKGQDRLNRNAGYLPEYIRQIVGEVHCRLSESS